MLKNFSLFPGWFLLFSSVNDQIFKNNTLKTFQNFLLLLKRFRLIYNTKVEWSSAVGLSLELKEVTSGSSSMCITHAVFQKYRYYETSNCNIAIAFIRWIVVFYCCTHNIDALLLNAERLIFRVMHESPCFINMHRTFMLYCFT